MTKMCAILQLVSALLNPSTSLHPSTNPSCNGMINIFDEQLKTALFLQMKSGCVSKKK